MPGARATNLFAAASDVVVADVGEVILLVLALDGLALSVNDGVLGNNAVLRRIRLDHLELNRAHTAADKEGVALANGPVGWIWEEYCDALNVSRRIEGCDRDRCEHTLKEVGLEIDLKEVASQALDRVVKRQDVDPLAVLDVCASMNRAKVAEPDADVVTCDWMA